jgi:hypothetical protein
MKWRGVCRAARRLAAISPIDHLPPIKALPLPLRGHGNNPATIQIQVSRNWKHAKPTSASIKLCRSSRCICRGDAPLGGETSPTSRRSALLRPVCQPTVSNYATRSRPSLYFDRTPPPYIELIVYRFNPSARKPRLSSCISVCVTTGARTGIEPSALRRRFTSDHETALTARVAFCTAHAAPRRPLDHIRDYSTAFAGRLRGRGMPLGAQLIELTDLRIQVVPDRVLDIGVGVGQVVDAELLEGVGKGVGGIGEISRSRGICREPFLQV